MSMICAWCKIRNCNVYEVDVCLKAKKTEERVNDAKSKFRGGLHGWQMTVRSLLSSLSFSEVRRRAPSHPPRRDAWRVFLAEKTLQRKLKLAVRPSLIYVWNRSLTYTVLGYPFRCIWLLRFVSTSELVRYSYVAAERWATSTLFYLSPSPPSSSTVETLPASRKVTDAPSIITGLTLKNIGRIFQTRKADKLRQFWNFDKLV